MTPKYRLFTEDDVAKWIGVSVATVRTWRFRPPNDCEPIPYTKVGGKIRYREDVVLKWLETNTITPKK